MFKKRSMVFVDARTWKDFLSVLPPSGADVRDCDDLNIAIRSGTPPIRCCMPIFHDKAKSDERSAQRLNRTHRFLHFVIAILLNYQGIYNSVRSGALCL